MDIVKRLRKRAFVEKKAISDEVSEAADEIERLREALKSICKISLDQSAYNMMQTLARAALKGDE